MPNPTIGNESQFTPSYSWGNGYSSFDIATEQETLISGKNPTLNAKRIRKNIAYDFSGKQTSNEIELVSQFQSYGRKFISTTETDVAIIEKTEYSGNAYTPAGINAYLTNINTTVNPSNMAGTQNSNLQNNSEAIISKGVAAALGASGVTSAVPFSNALLSQAGLLDPTYATAPLQLLNNKIGFQGTGIAIPYPDFRTRKFNPNNEKFLSQLGATVFQRRIDGLSAQTRAKTATPGAYAALAATIGPYNVFNLDSTYGWGQQDSPSAIRADFTLRSNVASSWDFKSLRNLQKQLKSSSNPPKFAQKLGYVFRQTANILERITPFRGDKVNVIDFSQRSWTDIYRWLPEKPGDVDTGFERVANKATDILGVNPYGTTKDFIKFFFTGPKLHAGDKTNADDVIVFRAILSSLSDQFSPSWTPVNIIGRPDTNYHYGGYSRTVDLGFTIYATDRDELRFIYRKLNALAGYTAPEYVDSYALKGPWIRVTIGDYFLSQPAIIESLSYTFVDSDTTWEINIEEDPYMKQVTHKIDVSMGLNMITEYLPQKGGSFYTLASVDKIGENGRPLLTDKDGWLNDTKTVLGVGIGNSGKGKATPDQPTKNQE